MTGARITGRRAARLAAVQALYQMEMTGIGEDAVIDEFTAHRLGNDVEGYEVVGADPDFFSTLVHGVVADQDRIDALIANTVSADWSLRRLNATLRALVRAGTYELLSLPDVPARVVLDEYVELAHAFFSEGEPAFANGVLDKIAHSLRADEFAGSARATFNDAG